jgi:hypothetical protein
VCNECGGPRSPSIAHSLLCSVTATLAAARSKRKRNFSPDSGVSLGSDWKLPHECALPDPWRWAVRTTPTFVVAARSLACHPGQSLRPSRARFAINVGPENQTAALALQRSRALIRALLL